MPRHAVAPKKTTPRRDPQPASAPRRKVGRTGKPISVRIPPKQLARLRAKAKADDRPLSSYLRQLIDRDVGPGEDTGEE